MSRAAILFYAVVGSALALCLVVLAGMKHAERKRMKKPEKERAMKEEEDHA